MVQIYKTFLICVTLEKIEIKYHWKFGSSKYYTGSTIINVIVITIPLGVVHYYHKRNSNSQPNMIVRENVYPSDRAEIRTITVTNMIVTI